MQLSWYQFLTLAGAVLAIGLFVLFWFRPEKTSKTLLLFLSALKHFLRLKKEVKGEPVQEEPRRKPGIGAGTISAYVEPEDRQPPKRRSR